jgi:hypothetical protein
VVGGAGHLNEAGSELSAGRCGHTLRLFHICSRADC